MLTFKKSRYVRKKKTCEICLQIYSPNSNLQKRCFECRVGICDHCGKEYVKIAGTHTYKFCSVACYQNHRWGNGIKCKYCSKPIEKGRYCSPQCQRYFWNRNDYKLKKKTRFWKLKLELIDKLGGKCIRCGISDFRILDINHKDRTKKIIPPNRHYTWQQRLKEWNGNLENLELLCANCHRIHTWEQMKYGGNQSYIDMALKRLEPYLLQTRLPI